MSDKLKWQAILDICSISKKMWQKGFVANHDGNVTVRVGDSLLATPTAISKADMIPEIALTLDMDGKKIAGPGNPFSEIGLHLAAYRSRPDTVAVVHAHPPYATARGACGLALDKPFVPESVVSLGDNIPVATFAMPGSPENEKMVSSLLQCSNVIMLAGNGVLAIGTDAMQAYLRLELVEHLCKMDFIANHMGRPFELSAGDRAKLLEKREKAGLATPLTSASATSGPDQDQERLIKIITEEVASILGK